MLKLSIQRLVSPRLSLRTLSISSTNQVSFLKHLNQLLLNISEHLNVNKCFYPQSGSSDAPYSKNDVIAPRVRNKNPMNLEKMLIGKKPRGWDLENR